MREKVKLIQNFIRQECCPVCGSELYQQDIDDYECPNKCYCTFNYDLNNVMYWQITIYDTFWTINLGHDIECIKEEFGLIQKFIDYWRENERYLAQILTKE